MQDSQRITLELPGAGAFETAIAASVDNNALLNVLADGANPADKSGHPFEEDEIPRPSRLSIKPIEIDDPTLYVYVKQLGGTGMTKLKAHDALTSVTGLSFLHLGIGRLKHELRAREIKLSTGLRGRERLMELSSRLEKAVISERNRKLRREGKDKLSMLRKDLKLVGAHVAKMARTLFEAAVLRSDFEHMRTMIRRGVANANFESEDAFTPLIKAAFCLDALATCDLLDLGADPDRENMAGESPLVWAASMPGGKSVILALCGVSAKSKAAVSRSSPRSGGGNSDSDDDDDDMFADPKDPKKNKKATPESSALTLKSDKNSPRETLNPNRPHASIDRETQLGTTGLMAAAEVGIQENVEALVELGANINYKSRRRGLSALMVAARHGHESICFYLLDHGAIVNSKDSGGRGAKEWARLGGYHKLAETIESQSWRWKRAEVRKNAGKKLWGKLKIKSRAMRFEAGWDVHIDTETGTEFFVNTSTGLSQWEMPPSVLNSRRSKWTERRDPASGKMYYYNDAGDTTYVKPAILDKNWRSQTKRTRNELEEVLRKMEIKARPDSKSGKRGKVGDAAETALATNEEVDTSVLEKLIARTRRSGLRPIIPPLRKVDGYHGVTRIVSVVKHIQRDKLRVTKLEWDARLGGVRGRQSALHRSQEAKSEYWADFTVGPLGFFIRAPYPKPGCHAVGVFVSKVVADTQAAKDGSRIKIGHWIQQINGETVRHLESTKVARMLDRTERPFRIKFQVPACVCDYCGGTSPHTVCVTCDAIMCIECIIASKHSIRHPNHRCKTIADLGRELLAGLPGGESPETKKKMLRKKKLLKQMRRREARKKKAEAAAAAAAAAGGARNTAQLAIIDDALNSGGSDDGDDVSSDDDDDDIIEPKVAYSQLVTLRHSLTTANGLKATMEAVLRPAHNEWRLMGGERYMSIEDREKRNAEARRLHRAEMEIYKDPPEHNLAMWCSGMGRHEQARKTIRSCIDVQEKRLAGDPPIVEPIAASYSVAATVESNAGERQGAIKYLLQALTLMVPGDPNYHVQFDRLASYLMTYGMIRLQEMDDAGELEAQHTLLPICFHRAQALEQKRERERMVMFDEDAEEKPITLSDAANPHDVEEMLRDEIGVKLFEEFCSGEATDHYVRFWVKVWRFKRYERAGVHIDPEEARRLRRKKKKEDSKKVQPIPDGWQELFDQSVSGQGASYFFNESTGEVTWDRPRPVTPEAERRQNQRVRELEERPRKAISHIYGKFIRPKALGCITNAHYNELTDRASNADYTYDMFDHSQELVFNVLIETYRRFLTSNLGSRYLWKKLLTNRLKMGLIHSQAVARGWLQRRATIVRRVLLLRAHDLATQLSTMKEREIMAATIIQTTIRAWVARIQVRRARQALHRIWLLEMYSERALRVESAMSLQNWIRRVNDTWEDVLEIRHKLCEVMIRRWDPEGGPAISGRRGDPGAGADYYWDCRTKKKVRKKPPIMKSQVVPRREMCIVCNAESYVSRWCLQCSTLECENCYIKRHGPDDLEDDLEAADLLGTASFRMDTPMHRHGWCMIPGTPASEMCVECKVRVANWIHTIPAAAAATAAAAAAAEETQAESGEAKAENVEESRGQVRHLCRECAPVVIEDVAARVQKAPAANTAKEKKNDDFYGAKDDDSDGDDNDDEEEDEKEEEETKVQVERVEPKMWRTRYRGMDDLDSDEEGAYDTWPEQIEREKTDDYW
jgi:ankyrin repeat protein